MCRLSDNRKFILYCTFLQYTVETEHYNVLLYTVVFNMTLSTKLAEVVFGLLSVPLSVCVFVSSKFLSPATQLAQN